MGAIFGGAPSMPTYTPPPPPPPPPAPAPAPAAMVAEPTILTSDEMKGRSKAAARRSLAGIGATSEDNLGKPTLLG